MTYLPFWAGALALCGAALAHQALVGRALGVSGRFTAIVEAARRRAAGEAQVSDAAMIEALRAMTEAEFGIEAGEPVVAPRRETPTPATHALFMVGVLLGAFVVALATGTFTPSATLVDPGFAAFAGTGAGAIATLFSGGVLVGIGTRMAGGCTSGHGLIGVATLKPGSLVATAAFFGAGIVASFALEVLR